LKKSIQILYKKLDIKSERTRNISKHVLLSFLYKGGSIISGLLLVPITIAYLDTEHYGIWLTLSAFISWFSFFDIGLGNGLRNKFAEAKTKGDVTLAKGYVSSAYFTIGAVSFGLMVAFFTLNFFIDWSIVFNTTSNLKKELGLLMPIVFGFFCMQLVVKLITTIYTADQHHSMQGKVNFYIQAGSLLLVFILTKTSGGSLLLFGTIFSVLPVFILLLYNIIAFNGKYKEYKPSIRMWKKEYLKDIFGLGTVFFIIQISGTILYSTDSLIISKLFSPSAVIPYHISYKYISISSMLFSIIAAPLWSSVTDAYCQSDSEWIKKTMKNFQKTSFYFILLILIMVVFSKFIYLFWVGPAVNVNIYLTMLMAVFFACTIFVTPYTMFLNGIGKIKLQAIQSVFAAILNIPLSIFLSRNLDLGIKGVILATIICFLPSTILMPIQYFKIVNNKAINIWNK